MLSVENISFFYKPNYNILKDISFNLAEKDIMCILGPNGTGKTTLLRCLLGLNQIKSGRITIDGKDLSRVTAKQRAKMIAYVPQSTTMTFSYEARAVVLMGRIAHLSFGRTHTKSDRLIAEESMEKLGIRHLGKCLFQQLSGGERQMVLVARALAQQSNILVMDEPTANLDFSNQIKILKVINNLSKQGYAILMTSHFPDHSFLACNKAMLMRDGIITYQGNPEDVVTTSSLTQLYGTPVCVTNAKINHKGDMTKVCVPLIE